MVVLQEHGRSLIVDLYTFCGLARLGGVFALACARGSSFVQVERNVVISENGGDL